MLGRLTSSIVQAVVKSTTPDPSSMLLSRAGWREMSMLVVTLSVATKLSATLFGPNQI